LCFITLSSKVSEALSFKIAFFLGVGCGEIDFLVSGLLIEG
jgi:hypothetical protein